MSRKERSKEMAARLKALQEKMGSVDVGDSAFWRPPQGRSLVRILPPVGNMKWYFQEVGKHYNLPPDNTSETCPSYTTGGKEACPICELVRKLYRSGSKEDRALASKLRVRKQFWMNVIVRKEEDEGGETGEGPFVYTPGTSVFKVCQALANDPDFGDISDVEDGIDLNIDRTGEGLETEYSTTTRRFDTPLHTDPEQIAAWLDEAEDLSYVLLSEDPDEDEELGQGAMVQLLPYNRIVEKYGLSPDVDAGEEGPEDTKPADDDDVGKEIRQRRERRSRRR